LFKVVWVAKFHPDLTRAEGSRRWNEVHGHLGLKVPGLTGYVQNFCVGTLEGIDSIDDAGVSDGRPPFDGYACEWHESNDAFQEGLRSPEWKKVTEDGKSLWAKSSLEHMCAAIEQRTMRDGPHSAFKVAIFFRFRPDLNRDEASEYWLETHGRLALKVPGIDRYVQNLVVGAIDNKVGVKNGPVTYDGFSEVWFKDKDAFESARRSAEWVNELTRDGDNVFEREVMRKMSVIVEERVLREEPSD
jgi:uncharacterized protein (TIGR02118 family)